MGWDLKLNQNSLEIHVTPTTSSLGTQDLWFWSGAAWWCSLIKHRKITTFCCGKVEQSCELMMYLGVLQSLPLGLKPVDPAQFYPSFKQEPCCISQDVADTGALGSYLSLITLLGKDPPRCQLWRAINNPFLKTLLQCCYTGFAPCRALRVVLTCLVVVFLWDTDLIEKLWWGFLYILESALPVMRGWAGPLQMVAEKSQGTYSPNSIPANLLFNYFTSFFHLENRNESVTEHQTLVCAMPYILLPPHLSCSFSQTASSVQPPPTYL